MLWLFKQFPSYIIRFNDIVKTHLSFNGTVRMLLDTYIFAPSMQ